MDEYYTRSSTSEDVSFKGKATWAQLKRLNKFGKWSINIYPDAESLEKLREIQADGVKKQIKKDENGYYFELSRPPFIEFRKGIKTPLTDPFMKFQDGSAHEGLVGDGTDCIAHCEVYTYKVPNTERRGKAVRLLGIEIINLVPYGD